MAVRRKYRFPGLLLAVTVCCITPTGGGKSESSGGAGETPKLAIGRCTLTGNVREFNDDAVAVEDLSGSALCLVADGMGGEVGGKILGQIAARRAFDVVTGELRKGLPRAT